MTSTTLDLLLGGGSSSFSYSMSMQNWWEQWRLLSGPGEWLGVELTKNASPKIKTKKWLFSNNTDAELRLPSTCISSHDSRTRLLWTISACLRFSDWDRVVDAYAVCISLGISKCVTLPAESASQHPHPLSLLDLITKGMRQLTRLAFGFYRVSKKKPFTTNCSALPLGPELWT